MSPIERKLYDALIRCLPSEYELQDLVDDCSYGGGEYACLESQVPIASYFADLLLTANAGGRLVLECDGHDFHNVTKQQAAYDRARDRELLAMGIRTMRFTGSEIHHNADKCAAEAWRVFALVVKEDYAPMLDYQSGYDAGVASTTATPPTKADI
jgi:very-short-patch-repair endonuclease